MRTTTLDALKTICRQRADMENSDFIGDDSSNQELTNYINDSISELHDLIIHSFEDYQVTSRVFQITSANDIYPMPEDFYKMIRVEVDSNANFSNPIKLRPFSVNEWTRNTAGTIFYRTSYPITQYRVVGDKLILMPRPSQGGFLRMWYYPPSKKLSDDVRTLEVTDFDYVSDTISFSNHGYYVGDRISFSTTGTLPDSLPIEKATILDGSTADILLDFIPTAWTVNAPIVLKNVSPPYDVIVHLKILSMDRTTSTIRMVVTDSGAPILTAVDLNANTLELTNQPNPTLVSDADYYTVPINKNKFNLASSLQNAHDNIILDLTGIEKDSNTFDSSSGWITVTGGGSVTFNGVATIIPNLSLNLTNCGIVTDHNIILAAGDEITFDLQYSYTGGANGVQLYAKLSEQQNLSQSFDTKGGLLISNFSGSDHAQLETSFGDIGDFPTLPDTLYNFKFKINTDGTLSIYYKLSTSTDYTLIGGDATHDDGGSVSWIGRPVYMFFSNTGLFSGFPSMIIDNYTVKSATYGSGLITISDDRSIYDGQNGWEEYVVVDVAMKMLEKEESDTTALMARKMALIDRVKRLSKDRDSGEPHRMIDIYQEMNYPNYRHRAF